MREGEPNKGRPRPPRVTCCPARESVIRAYSRHTADQSPLRRRIYCCQLRDLFSFFHLSALSSSLLLSTSLSLYPLIAFVDFVRRARSSKKKKRGGVYTCGGGGASFDLRIDFRGWSRRRLIHDAICLTNYEIFFASRLH